MKRRDFLITSAKTLGAAAAPLGWQPQRATGSKTDRVAIMAYSFVSVLKLPGRPSSPERTLDVFDVPEMFADRYNVHNVEMQHNYFESTEASYLKDFLARLAKTKSRVSNINLELGNMNIAAADPALRAQAVDLTKAWIDHAVLLGSPRVMINQGKLTQENKAAAIETLTRMTAYAKTKKMMVGAEPRGDDFTLLTEVILGRWREDESGRGEFRRRPGAPARRDPRHVPPYRRQLSHEDAESADLRSCGGDRAHQIAGVHRTLLDRERAAGRSLTKTSRRSTTSSWPTSRYMGQRRADLS